MCGQHLCASILTGARVCVCVRDHAYRFYGHFGPCVLLRGHVGERVSSACGFSTAPRLCPLSVYKGRCSVHGGFALIS